VGSPILISALWGYAEADPTVVGIVIGIFAIIAVLYGVVRVTGKSGAGKSDRPGRRDRG
jgi:hypothetical protein